MLKGKVSDAIDKSNIAGATVKLTMQRDSNFSKMVVTDNRGNFQFKNLNPAFYTITVSNVGYTKVEQKINMQASNTTAIPFSITKTITDLAGVTVTSKEVGVRQKADTIEFSASQFKVNPDATAEDLIKKLPGITVAKDGTVTSMGEQVRKVTVDGKDFFGEDATAALRNLPADVIDKIQVFDRLSEQAQLTGFDDGNSVKTVNIVTKNGIKNGQFGRIFAGAGTDIRYASGGNISFFKANRRLSLVGNFNNINQQNFANQDLLGVISSGGGGGNRGGGFGAGNNFLVGQQGGINRTNAAGINYSNQFGKKLTISGSYFYNTAKNNNENTTSTQTFYTPKDLFSFQKQQSGSTNNNHRINMRVEYKLDSFNTIYFIPNISFQDNNSSSQTSTQNYYSTNDSISTSKNNTDSYRHGYNIRNTVMLRHSFRKRGRSLTLSINTGWNKNDGETTTKAAYKFYNNGIATDSIQNRLSDYNSDGKNYSATISYTEPIGKKGNLQIDYTPAVQKSSADQQTFNYDGAKYSIFDPTISNLFDNTITTNNAGINYRLNKSRDEQLSVGINLQSSQLESQRIYPKAANVNQNFANILPNLMYRKKVGKYSNIRSFYRASTVFPNITQLQDVVNLNNPLRVSTGNPDLKQSFTHFLSGRYSYTNTKSSKSFFANLILQTASNSISNGTFVASADSTIQQNIVLKKGSQLSKPINLDGYNNLNTFFTYSMPLKFIKTTLNVNAGFNYSKQPGYVRNKKIFTNTYGYNTGVVLGSNISEFIDYNVSYSANWYQSKTNTSTSVTTKYVNQSAGVQLNLLSKKGGWMLQNDVSGNMYSGLSSGFNQQYWLWNASAGKKIFKKHSGEIKLTVFDLLKQNQSISRNITGSYIQDVQTQVLKQFFMLTFTYKLKNFGTPAKQTNNGERERRFNRQRGEGGGNPQGGGYVPGF